MNETGGPRVGMVVWNDLTVEDAEGIRDFYGDVVGWRSDPVEMDGYSDFSMMTPGDGSAAAGICHARGTNADLPPQWLLYIIVEDVEESAARCRERGGEVISGPREMGGHGRYCVIRDPAGAVAALFQPAA